MTIIGKGVWDPTFFHPGGKGEFWEQPTFAHWYGPMDPASAQGHWGPYSLGHDKGGGKVKGDPNRTFCDH